jgi:hypothetical protein
MRAVQSSRRRSFFLLVSLAAAFPFLLAACGANGSGSTSTGSAPSPVPTSTSTGRVSSNGCPSNAVVGTAPAPATLVLKPSDSRSTINAHLGDVIEIQLPFGQAWSGPTSSQGMLQLQPPAGYAWNTAKACVWRFLVQSTGTTQLNFFGKAICKKGEMCPQYIVSLPFTISVK